jgi:cell division transport system permease protein
MKTLLYNLGYFVSEAVRTIRLHPFSNLFSVIATGLIFFLLGMVIAGWFVGDELIAKLNEEAEVSAYFSEETDVTKQQNVVEIVKALPGVLNARYITEDEARSRMDGVLGEEAGILELFEKNPFEPFIEIQIILQDIDTILEKTRNIEGIDYVRDNQEVLGQVKSFTEGFKLVGFLIIVAVGITTMIIISHMIRQGIYNNREQINTLRLLGAPESFIGIPFVLAGLILTLAGGILAVIGIVAIINIIFTQLNGLMPFIPMPSKIELINNISMLLLGISLILGLLGSLLGLTSIKTKESS